MKTKQTKRRKKPSKYTVPVFLTLLLAVIAAIVLSSCNAHLHAKTEDVFRRTASSTVFIETGEGTGSGTVVGEKLGGALILTCSHVIAPSEANHIKISPSTGPGDGRWSAIVVRRDVKLDLLLLWAPGYEAPAIRVAEKDPTLYEEMFIVASPHGLSGSASTGWLSDKHIPLDFGEGDPRTGAITWSVTAGFTLAGVSGGTIVNKDGELACVPEAGVMKLYPSIPLGATPIQIAQVTFCIPGADIRKFLGAA